MRRRNEEALKEKVLDVDASMQGTLTFKDPVNLRINGKFEGRLEAKGNLTIGEHATVTASIKGEHIVIAGSVNGNITAEKSLRIVAPAKILGDIETPLLSVTDGALLEGACSMISGSSRGSGRDMLSIDEVAKYLEVDKNVVVEWADTGKLPGVKEGARWRFDKSQVDSWLSSEKIK